MHRHLYTASGINHGENHRDTKEFVLSVRIRDDAPTTRIPSTTVYSIRIKLRLYIYIKIRPLGQYYLQKLILEFSATIL